MRVATVVPWMMAVLMRIGLIRCHLRMSPVFIGKFGLRQAIEQEKG